MVQDETVLSLHTNSGTAMQTLLDLMGMVRNPLGAGSRSIPAQTVACHCANCGTGLVKRGTDDCCHATHNLNKA